MKNLHGSTLQDVTLMNTILVNKKIMSERYCLLTLGFPFNKNINGGFQLEFVSISWVINRMNCNKLRALIILQHSDWRANLVRDFF